MDYLQGAIEKARTKGEGAIGRTPMPGETDGQRPSRDRNMSASGLAHQQNPREYSSEHLGPLDVNYSETRSVELNENDLSENRVIASNIEDPRVEAYRQLRSQVLTAMKANGWRTLAITSAQEGAGKSLTAVNLAISISREVNQTVLLVDLDLRDPSVHETLGLEVELGIVDHLQKGVPLEDVMINPGYPRLVVVPGTPQGRHLSETLTSPEMARFMEEITTRYEDRIVIFDLPPLLRNDDALVFVPRTDACLFVVEDGKTTPDDLYRSMQLLKGVELLGTVLNKAR